MVDDYLVYDNNGNGTHSYGVFEQEYRIICDEIRSQLAPANGTKAAFFPQRIQNPGGVNQPISYIHWFTDSILCVSCNQNGDGVLAVPGKDFKCVLLCRNPYHLLGQCCLERLLHGLGNRCWYANLHLLP